jgi:hypothetical protein
VTLASHAATIGIPVPTWLAAGIRTGMSETRRLRTIAGQSSVEEAS